jgi:hypothetical protein
MLREQQSLRVGIVYIDRARAAIAKALGEQPEK